MLKKILLTLLLLVPAVMSAQKFATVNPARILEALPEYKDSMTKIEEASRLYEEEYGRLQNEFNKKYTELQQVQNAPAAIKERRMQEVQELDQKIQQFRQTVQDDLPRQREALLSPLRERVDNAIRAFGATGGYTVIFRTDATAYTDYNVEDVTDLIIMKLGLTTY